MISPLAALRWNRNLPAVSLLISNLAAIAVLLVRLLEQGKRCAFATSRNRCEAEPTRGAHPAAHPPRYRGQRPTPRSARRPVTKNGTKLTLGPPVFAFT